MPTIFSVASVIVWCEGEIAKSDCAALARTALDAVTSKGWTATGVWLTPDYQCQDGNRLFWTPASKWDHPHCPLGSLPSGEDWAGFAEVSFAGHAEHAGLDLIRSDRSFESVLIGYTVPSPGWCSGDCPSPSPS